MAFTDKYAGLENLEARASDGSGNTEGGQVGDVYARITDPQYETNLSDGAFGAPFSGIPGPNGMVLPVVPTNPPPIPIPFQSSFVGNMPQARGRLRLRSWRWRRTTRTIRALLPSTSCSTLSGRLIDPRRGRGLDTVGRSSPDADRRPTVSVRPHAGVNRQQGVRQQINEEIELPRSEHGLRQQPGARGPCAGRHLPSGGGVQSAKLLLGADGLLPTIGEVAANSGIDNDAGKSGCSRSRIFTEDGFAGLPNPATTRRTPHFENLYYAGDNRVNQQGPLITMQTIWAREHNYQVDQITPYATATAGRRTSCSKRRAPSPRPNGSTSSSRSTCRP